MLAHTRIHLVCTTICAFAGQWRGDSVGFWWSSGKDTVALCCKPKNRSQPFPVQFHIRAKFISGAMCRILTCFMLIDLYPGLSYISNLLKAGANIDAQDHSGMTPLHLACRFGNISLVRTCLQISPDCPSNGYDDKSKNDRPGDDGTLRSVSTPGASASSRKKFTRNQKRL